MNANEDKKNERETEAYRMFMKVAKRVSRIEYGKWVIEPDVNDPLRKFIMKRDIGWATMQVSLILQEFYHRGVYNGTRWDFRPIIGISGLFQGGKALDTGLKLRPRMALKLIKVINEVVIPKWYEGIEQDKLSHEEEAKRKKMFADRVSLVKGLKVTLSTNRWSTNMGQLANCPLQLEVRDTGIVINNEIDCNTFAEIAKAMKWGDYANDVNSD